MSELRILVTGSRVWMDVGAVRRALANEVARRTRADPMVLVHGGAPGADAIADQLWRGWMFLGNLAEPEVHPADWGRYGKRAGFVRNAEMVALGATVCLAFPLGESRGTRMCMDLAHRAGIPVISYEQESP